MLEFIKRIFQKPDLTPADLGQLCTDVHSHLLPGIDDGAQTLEDSIQLISELSKLGYQRFITTPHIMGDFYRNSPETILPKLDLVREELAKRNMNYPIDAAAEYYLDAEFSDKLKKGNLLSFDKNYLLFELSFMNPPDGLDATVFEIQTKGYTPVLAHPERYLYWIDKLDRLEELRERGVLFQLNLLSIVGHYGPPSKKFAEKLIDKNWFEFLGSDLHNMKHIASINRGIADPYLKKALELGLAKNKSL
ncbi:MAG: capsular biosynthesis protein [Bacteroidia bacterium]|nr:capsular biosynthesis protein [Bacteroidia bacterium]